MKKPIKKSRNNREVMKAIEHLAMITKKGFDSSVSSADFKEFKEEMILLKDGMNSFRKETHQSLFSIDNKVQDIDKRLKKVEEAVDPLLTGYRIMQNEMRDHDSRLSILEKKAGIK